MGRINLDIDDEIHHRCKVFAVTKGLTLPESVNEILKIGLEAIDARAKSQNPG